MTHLKIKLVFIACSLATSALSQTTSDVKAQAACATRGPACIRYLQERRLPPSLRGALERSAGAPANIPATVQYNFLTLVIPESTFAAQANGINKSGVVAGFYYDVNFNAHGFIWQQGTSVTVDYPGATSTMLNGINNHGLVIATIETDTSHAAIYSLSSGAWTVLPDLPPIPSLGSGIGSQGLGINDDGVVSGNSGGGLGSVAWTFRLKTLQYHFFTEPGAAPDGTMAFAINEEGYTAGNFVNVPTSAGHAFLKQQDKFTSFDVPGAFVNYPTGINRVSTIVGPTFSYFGFVRTVDGNISDVTYPGSVETDIWGINDKGVLCGDWLDSNYIQNAVIATPVGQ